MTIHSETKHAEESPSAKLCRKPLRLENRGQLSLFSGEEMRTEADADARPGIRRYEDPRPEGILIGREDLRSFLESRGEKRAFQIRELLRSLPLEGFHQAAPSAGRRPYHPASMLGLILFGILEGRQSLRGMEMMARCDARMWWISGGIQPDHSVIGRFIQDHRKELQEEFFIELTQRVLKWSQSRGGDLSGDGTILQAASSRYRMLTLEAAENERQALSAAAVQDPGNARLVRQAHQAEESVAILRRREARRKANRWKGKTRINPHEPEAVVQPQKNRGGFAPSYKPVVLSNADQYIVSQIVHPSSEHAEYSHLLDQAEQSSGGIDRLRLDGGYFNFLVLEESERRKIELLCPEGKGTNAKTSPLYPKSAFRYDSGSDSYECPAGKLLVAMRQKGKRGRDYRYYGKADCGPCELRPHCTTNRKGRILKRWEGEELKEKARARMQVKSNQDEYRKRSFMVEPIFARIKQHQGLRRFKRRGLSGVRTEFALHAIAHNIARWIARGPAFGPLWVRISRSVRRFWAFWSPLEGMEINPFDFPSKEQQQTS